MESNFKIVQTKGVLADNKIGFCSNEIKPVYGDFGNKKEIDFEFKFLIRAKNQKEAAIKLRDYINS